jgi:cytochrome c
MSKAQKRLFLMGAVTVVASLSACGSGSEATKPASSSPAPADTTTESGAAWSSFAGDATRGEAVFGQCRACHVTQPGQNRQGPSLHGIVGRQAGTVANYAYSPANRDSGITWTPEKLFQFLENPRRVIPGTKMIYPGIKDPQQRADLIAWLQTQS